MIEAKLYTRAGDLVATILVPPFQQRQDLVLRWRRRFFRYRNGRWIEQVLFPVPVGAELVK